MKFSFQSNPMGLTNIVKNFDSGCNKFSTMDRLIPRSPTKMGTKGMLSWEPQSQEAPLGCPHEPNDQHLEEHKVKPFQENQFLPGWQVCGAA